MKNKLKAVHNHNNLKHFLNSTLVTVILVLTTAFPLQKLMATQDGPSPAWQLCYHIAHLSSTGMTENVSINPLTGKAAETADILRAYALYFEQLKGNSESAHFSAEHFLTGVNTLLANDGFSTTVSLVNGVGGPSIVHAGPSFMDMDFPILVSDETTSGGTCTDAGSCTGGTCTLLSNCTVGDCTKQENCTGGTLCTGGTECTLGSSCTGGAGCTLNQTCTTGGTCTTGTFCTGSGGSAQECTKSSACTDGSHCCNGVCTTGDACSRGRHCTEGGCSGGDGCTSGSLCSFGEFCSSGPNCTTGSMCSGGSLCTDRTGCSCAANCSVASGICPVRKDLPKEFSFQTGKVFVFFSLALIGMIIHRTS